MNATSLPIDSDADEQASLWAARLEATHLTPEQRIAFDAWLAADPSHRIRLSSYCQLSADLEPRLAALAEAGRVAAPFTFEHPARRLRVFATGAALAAAACAAFIFWPSRPTVDWVHQIATASGQFETLDLPDGTRIDLFPQTNLHVDLSSPERRVRLAAGEAYFDVAHDPSRPFIVETPAGAVRVTGTAFSVEASPEGMLNVLVAQGSVQVHPGEGSVAPLALKAGQRLAAAVNNLHLDTLSPEAVDAALAWREGQVVFDATPLAEALARFARYHGRGLVASPEAARLTVGGRYRLNDLDGFLAALEAVLPVQASRGVNGVIRVEQRIAR